MLEITLVGVGLIMILFFDLMWANLFVMIVIRGVFIALEMNYEIVEWHVGIEGLG